MAKVAVVVLADTQTDEGFGRLYNALAAVQEFKEAGDAVSLFFDGAGTRWIGRLVEPGHAAHTLYTAVSDTISAVCSGRAAVFGATEAVQAQDGVPVGQISYRDLVAQGYQILLF
jgi:hypothetical protein